MKFYPKLKFCVLNDGVPESRHYEVRKVTKDMLTMNTYDNQGNVIKRGLYPQFKKNDFIKLFNNGKLKIL